MKSSIPFSFNRWYSFRIEEVFSWLFEIADDAKELGDGGKIVWSVMYLYDNSKLKDAPIDNAGLDDNKRRLIAKLEINKDDIQAVLPMAKVYIPFPDCQFFLCK